MANSIKRNDPTSRVAAGVKTAMLVCVIGFIALAASRVLTPTAVAPYEVAPAVAAPIVAPTSDYAMPAPASSAESATSKDDGDNHPASF